MVSDLLLVLLQELQVPLQGRDAGESVYINDNSWTRGSPVDGFGEVQRAPVSDNADPDGRAHFENHAIIAGSHLKKLRVLRAWLQEAGKRLLNQHLRAVGRDVSYFKGDLARRR